ncbi:MAG: hypothetical protein ABI779_24160 [Acidobacteriota bacterium]
MAQNGRLHLLAGLALVLLLGTGASAEEGPRFPIESITFAGASAKSAAILLAESRLREGETYAEADLRDAVARMDRLPFVLDADFRLEKGSVRGQYVLVVSVTETLPLFVSFNSLQHWVDTVRVADIQASAPDEAPVIEYAHGIEHGNEDLGTVGGRWFFGARGVAHAAVDYSSCGGCPSRFPRVSAGYTRYDVLGSGATVSVVAQFRSASFDLPATFTGDTEASLSDRLAYQLTAAVPLFGNEAVRATLYRQTDPFSYMVKEGLTSVVRVERLHYDTASLSWLHDTTNDPSFPTRGTSWRVSVEARDRIQLRNGSPLRERDRDLSAAAAHYWELTPAQSLFAGAELQTLSDREFREVRAGAGYAASLWDRDHVLRYGDLRFELRAERVTSDYGSATAYGTARAGLALRGRWGVVGMALQYVGWRTRAE